jgi:NAD(P)-dependent dehydrogenase (short-subunit alcohol dehydrogenase family)
VDRAEPRGNRAAVVVGGTHGIGRAVVDALLADGVRVLLTGRAPRTVEAARRDLGDRAVVLGVDLTDLADVDALGAAVERELGVVDAVFLNAGHATLAALADVTPADYDHTFAVNARGTFFAMQRLAPRVRDGGAIVVTTSIADVTGTPGMAAYSGAKAAVRAFTRVLAAELLPRRVRVNAVSPGFVRTPTMGIAGASADDRAAFEKEGAAVTPLGRIADPAEVARAAMFLAFDATFTTGAELPVDGGLAQGLEVPHAG